MAVRLVPPCVWVVGVLLRGDVKDRVRMQLTQLCVVYSAFETFAALFVGEFYRGQPDSVTN